MTRTPSNGQGWSPGAPVQEGIFSRSARRDLADLNRQYLELGLRPESSRDPLFGWTDDVRGQIAGAEPEVRERMAACPFALFELRIPVGDSVPGTEFLAEMDRVEDRPGSVGSTGMRFAGCTAFAHGALFTAWRLADSAPLIARIAFGLSSDAELELNGTCPTRIAWLATDPRVVRVRWPAHSQFWSMLRAAAEAGSGSALQRAHCAGICLMDG